eukprot:Sdes_comp14253_c0_seq1m3445
MWRSFSSLARRCCHSKWNFSSTRNFCAVHQNKKSQKGSPKLLYTVGALVGLGGYTYYFSRDSTWWGYKQVILPLFRLLPAETAHNLSLYLTQIGLAPCDLSETDPILSTTLWGITFPNPVGLAAGYDKGADAVEGLFQLGFGLVEVGTVTPEPQPGNPAPRLFRLLESQAIINRYGFNSQGLEAMEPKLAQFRSRHKLGAKAGFLGVNVGKNKASTAPYDDFVCGIQTLAKYADYLVVNVSSPNTPGLRALQSKAQLSDLIDASVAARDAFSATRENPQHRPPVLIKIAPDLCEQDLEDIATVCMEKKVDGLIISNTTLSRPIPAGEYKEEAGGLSGKPLFEMSTSVLKKMYRLTHGTIPLIGAGGIFSAEDAYQKIRSGASLIQIYTSLVYEGPAVVADIKRGLSERLQRDGFKHISEAVGVDAP